MLPSLSKSKSLFIFPKSKNGNYVRDQGQLQLKVFIIITCVINGYAGYHVIYLYSQQR
jgi:hypothetical protein